MLQHLLRGRSSIRDTHRIIHAIKETPMDGDDSLTMLSALAENFPAVLVAIKYCLYTAGIFLVVVGMYYWGSGSGGSRGQHSHGSGVIVSMIIGGSSSRYARSERISPSPQISSSAFPGKLILIFPTLSGWSRKLAFPPPIPSNIRQDQAQRQLISLIRYQSRSKTSGCRNYRS